MSSTRSSILLDDPDSSPPLPLAPGKAVASRSPSQRSSRTSDGLSILDGQRDSFLHVGHCAHDRAQLAFETTTAELDAQEGHAWRVQPRHCSM